MSETQFSAVLERYRPCLDAAATLGRFWSQADKALAGVTVEGWRAPGFSPVIYTAAEPPDASVLHFLEDIPRSEEADGNTAIDPRPYLLICEQNYRADQENYDKVMLSNGWQVQEDPLSFNRILPPLPLVVPLDSHVVFRDITRAPMSNDHRDLLTECFDLLPEHIDRIEELYHRSSAKTLSVLVYRTFDATLVAVGTVSILKGRAMMTWGCVHPEHRGMDLHRTLVSGCATVAASHSVCQCWLATRNPLVRRKWSGNLELMIARGSA
ncbi:MAG: hypothetical protein ABJO09_09505 [Hyphomicrobiales bacterium]|uniref:hypothetical protein n=1 Tax=Roseibium sp. TaxID=1936156 RepID=UPI003265E151